MTPNPNPALEPQARRPVRKLPSAGGSLHIIGTYAADAAMAPVLAGLERDLAALRERLRAASVSA